MSETITPGSEGQEVSQLAPGSSVHIDTSLQIEQQKIPARARPVKAALSAFKYRSTSTYAKKEFKRAWLQDLNLLYTITKDCDGIEDVYSKVRQSLFHPKVKRRLDRCFDALRVFLKSQPSSTQAAHQVVRLRSHLAEAILTGFIAWERSVTFEHNGTGCLRATERPTRAANGAIDVTVRDCRPTKIQCTVHSFFAKNESHFKKIRLAIAAENHPSPELQQTNKTIDAAFQDPKCLCDNSKCRAMSDALIAVDGIGMDVFAANNPREWTTIASALGKPLINPVAR